MTISLSQKERMLLNDQKGHEEICVKKYNDYSNQAQDSQLKQLFSTYAGQEQQHLNTINQMLSGQVPTMGQQQGATQKQAQSAGQSGMKNQNDASLCQDMLMTEKYVSGSYDTAIYEFADENMRQALNHIQKEEQEHGKGIFDYMQSHGMYNAQQ